MNRKKVIYIGILLIITVIVSITAFSYAFLTRVDEQHGKLNIVVTTLDYKIESDDLNNNSITLVANESKEIELTIKSLNQIDSKYKLYTNSVENVTIGYLDEEGFDESTGIVESNGTVKVKIVLENDGDTSKTITFGVQGGFDYNEVALNTGRVEVEEGEALCNIVPGTAYEFDYTGSVQKLKIRCTGAYKVELWGAQGGDVTGFEGGKGGYTSGTIFLTKKDLYLYIGGAGGNTDIGGYNGGGSLTSGQSTIGASGGGSTDIRLVDGEWNDFNSLKSRIMVAAGGGGADKRGLGYGNGKGGNAGGLIGYNGEAIDTTNPSTNYTYGYAISTGGRQTTYGTVTWVAGEANPDISGGHGGFGVTNIPDGSEYEWAQSGAGNGYYSGGSGDHSGAGGGSSFISGHNGCIAIKETSTINNIVPRNGGNNSTCNEGTDDINCSIHYSNYAFNNTLMIDGAGYKWTTTKNNYIGQPQPDGTTAVGHSGNGYARVTYLGPYLDYNYTGTEQVFISPKSGTYKLETWGAQGGNYDATYHGGYGAYAKGNVSLTESEVLSVVVGGQPASNTVTGTNSGTACSGSYGGCGAIAGGYNGGGTGYHRIDCEMESGGGATHIAKKANTKYSILSSYNDSVTASNYVLIVSGGGGGASYYSSQRYGVGGNGGAVVGGSGSFGVNSNCEGYGYGGTQTAGGSYYILSGHAYQAAISIPTPTFGIGGPADKGVGGSGGGAGWYGGSGTSCLGGGGGGSGYIGNSLLTDKKMVCYNCTTSTDTATYTESNTCVSTAATADCSKQGNGYARITYIGN